MTAKHPGQIEQLGDRYRLRVRRDKCHEAIIVGRRGQIYEHGSGKLGVMFLGATAKIWGNARRKMLAAGYELHQNGDTEGSCLFQADNAEQMKVAFSVVGAFRSRKGQRAGVNPFKHSQFFPPKPLAPDGAGALETVDKVAVG